MRPPGDDFVVRPLGLCCRFLRWQDTELGTHPCSDLAASRQIIHTTTMGRFEGGPFCCPDVAGRYRVCSDDEDVADYMSSFAFCRPGSDLLSRDLSQSTIGAGAFHGRVRNGNGCSHSARTTRSAKRKARHREAGEIFISNYLISNAIFSLVFYQAAGNYPYRPVGRRPRLADARPERLQRVRTEEQSCRLWRQDDH